MAQLHQDYQEFLKKQVQVIVVGPEDAKAFEAYWRKHDLPFVGLPDPNASVLKLYGQEVNLFKLGRMPFDKSYAQSNLISLGIEIVLGVILVI
jgi:peroxiredoxin